jgi:hypothetical protein
MTRKDYVLIAQSFATSLQSVDTMVLDEHGYARFAVETAARGLAIRLHFDNPHFDADRFLEAAGVTACETCGTRAEYHGPSHHA